MRRDDLEADVGKIVGVDDALFDRAIAEHFDRRLQFRRNQPRVGGELGDLLRPTEGLECSGRHAERGPRSTPAIRLREMVSLAAADSNPIDVNRTASALTGLVGKSRARGTARGGA